VCCVAMSKGSMRQPFSRNVQIMGPGKSKGSKIKFPPELDTPVNLRKVRAATCSYVRCMVPRPIRSLLCGLAFSSHAAGAQHPSIYPAARRRTGLNPADALQRWHQAALYTEHAALFHALPSPDRRSSFSIGANGGRRERSGRGLRGGVGTTGQTVTNHSGGRRFGPDVHKPSPDECGMPLGRRR
jgi:hypothetical protein